FQFLPARNSSGDFVDELFHVHAQRDFVNAGFGDVPGYAKQARAAIFWGAAAGLFLPALEKYCRYGAECLDVVDDRRAAVEANDGREGRLDARIPSLAFQ